MSRSRPPEVDPVVVRGVRYGQDWRQPGLLVACDEKSGDKLWELQVYPSAQFSGLETDVQTVYFKNMVLTADGEVLLIENEKNETFKVHLERRMVEKKRSNKNF